MTKIHVISHTHWDREWYKPYQYFRTKLVYVIDHLLDLLSKNPAFTSFMLDGQTVVLEDYLRIRPENESRLKAYIAQGRIIVGPWYIQPDEFAPDAESLIRNLQFGICQAEKFGRPMPVGYLPDSFGHSSQMPQILNGFNINSAVVMRGVDADKIKSTEFCWKGLNGDEVLGIYLLKGYTNAMFLSKNNSFNKIRIEKTALELKNWTETDRVLIMNGIDHAFAQGQTASLCEDQPDWNLGTLEDYIHCIRQESDELKTLNGELITPRHHRVHTSIASTRIDQKRKNRQLSVYLERLAEPLCTITSLAGTPYPKGLLNEAWKTLILNQTHDGICGCCTDEVHREMDHRFTSVQQISETLAKNHSRAFAGSIDAEGLWLIVFNTALTTGPRPVEISVIVDQEFVILDEKGDQIEFQIESTEDIDVSKRSIFTFYLGTAQPAREVTFSIHCDFDMVLGYRLFKIVPCKYVESEQEGGKDLSFENMFYHLKINPNGSISLVDKQSGFHYDRLNLFEDIGEGGDSYNYSPLESDRPILSSDKSAEITVLNDGPIKKVFGIRQCIEIPEFLTPDGKRRRSKRVPLNIETVLSVYHQSRRIDFDVNIDNQALSHRLRVLFPFGEKVETSWAETQFGVIERSCTAIEGAEDWPETPLPIYSMQRFVGLKTPTRSLFLMNRGLPEYEVYQKKESVLAVTLHRGFSMMGKSNLAIRPGRPSGIEVPTPDAEAIGNLNREYSLIVGADLSLAEIVSEADRYTSPPLAVQNRINIDRILDGNSEFFQYFHIDNLTSILSEQMEQVPAVNKTYLNLRSSKLAVSAIKMAQADNSLIIRLFNPDISSVKDEILTICFPHDQLFTANLLEETQVEISGGPDYTLPEIKPNSQITLKVTREVINR